MHWKDCISVLYVKREFYETHEQKPAAEIKCFPSHINISKFSQGKAKLYEQDFSAKGLYDSQKSMWNGKSAGNDGLTKSFYETFLNELKETFVRFCVRN